MLEQFLITFQILIIDVVMAADNAIIIGLIAANFAPDNRKKIIALGVGAAFVFRIFFATGANYIFELVKSFNSYYQSTTILKVHDLEIKNFRLTLSNKVGEVIKNSMKLLGVEVPQKM